VDISDRHAPLVIENCPGQLSSFNALPSPLAEIGNRPLDLREVHRVGVADHGTTSRTDHHRMPICRIL